MKKTNALLLALVLCLALCACGGGNDTPIITEAPAVSTAPAEEDINVTDLLGTWKAAGVVIDGVSLTLDELNALGNASLNNYYVIIKDGGKAFVSTNENFVNWSTTGNTLVMDGKECSVVDRLITIVGKDFTLKLEKVSDSQDISNLSENEANTSTEETTGEQVDGMRPEFKEAMDTYEAFYDEYCNFMAEYMKNPSDMTLLLKYTEMLAKLEEMDTAFESWDEEDLNDAELKYYLDVNNRVMQKLIDVTG